MRGALLVSLVASACASAPPAPGPAAAPAALPAPSCGWDARGVIVAVEPAGGGRELWITAERARLRVAPGRGPWALVRGPLAFEGRAPASFRTTRALRAGAVELPPAHPVRLVDEVGGRPVVDARLGVHDRLGSPWAVDVAGLELSCADLTPADSDEARASDPLPLESGWLAVSRFPTVQLFDRHPEDGGRPTRVRQARVGFFVGERRGKLSRVTWRFSDGSALDGWALTDALRPPDAAERLDLRRAFAGRLPAPYVRPIGSSSFAGLYGYASGHGYGLRGRRARPPPFDGYVGEATLRRGAAVHASPTGGRWARVAVAVVARVRWRRGDAWVAVESVPGAGWLGADAWVRAADVERPRPGAADEVR